VSRRALLGAAAAAAVLLAALPFVGRWERDRHARSENARMAAVYRVATSDGLASPRLDAYRLAYLYDCLLYHPEGKPTATSAYEICFDGQGRLVQTIDRTTGAMPRIGSLLEQPALATLRVPVSRLRALFRQTGIFQDPHLAGRTAGPGLPSIGGDVGVKLLPHPPKG
jgi:hypothetical protein